MISDKKFKLAIFGSGGGSNAQSIINYFHHSVSAEIKLIISNKENAYILERANNEGIDAIIIDRPSFYDETTLLSVFEDYEIDLIILAGFLWLIPPYLIEAYPNKIINIHPALLPKYGGPGMYGKHVHQAVFDAREKESGMTVHFVNEKYDEGDIIAQFSTALEEIDSPEDIAAKVLKLEHAYYSEVIDQVIREIDLALASKLSE